MVKAIWKMPTKLALETRTDRVLRKVENEIFTTSGKDRPSRKNFIILFTDGKPWAQDTKVEVLKQNVRNAVSRLEVRLRLGVQRKHQANALYCKESDLRFVTAKNKNKKQTDAMIPAVSFYWSYWARVQCWNRRSQYSKQGCQGSLTGATSSTLRAVNDVLELASKICLCLPKCPPIVICALYPFCVWGTTSEIHSSFRAKAWK